MMGYGGYGWIGMIVSLIFAVGLIIGFVFLIVWAVRRMSQNSDSSGNRMASGQSAKEIAQMRYARGEISREEYQQLLADIER
jgi:putative membrane protein